MRWEKLQIVSFSFHVASNYGGTHNINDIFMKIKKKTTNLEGDVVEINELP